MDFSLTDSFTAGHSGNSLAGQLLVAAPSMTDPAFAQTVVYLCVHSPEAGAMGLVVNRRLPHPSFDDLLLQLNITPAPPEREIGLCAGGPVDTTRGFVLHSPDWEAADSIPVDDNASLTSSLDVLRDIAAGEGPRQAILALGHARWGAGQLEEEITRHSAWLVAPPDEKIIFGTAQAEKWRLALSSLRVDPLRLASGAGHA